MPCPGKQYRHRSAPHFQYKIIAPYTLSITIHSEHKKPARELLQGRSVLTEITIECFSRYFLSASLISVNKTSSADGLGGAAGAASSFFFMLFIALTTMKMAKAIIRKSMTV